MQTPPNSPDQRKDDSRTLADVPFEELVNETAVNALWRIADDGYPDAYEAVLDAVREEIGAYYDGPLTEYPHQTQRRVMDAAFPRVQQTLAENER